MNPIELSQEIEDRYRRYLETSFYFKDPELRQSFDKALKSGHLTQGPYLEATPVFKTGDSPRDFFEKKLDFQTDEGFINALLNKPLYLHQEKAISKAFEGHNIVVATGTGSGKTEAFLYPILLHLYKQFKAGTLGPGVRALILYPMNALANDQRDRLRILCKSLKDERSPFRFTFGQYIGETPEDENDGHRHARDYKSDRDQLDFCITENDEIVHGELIFRDEIRESPPNILLTNYSMLEYLLLRPDDSPLFDNDMAKGWKFIVLDEAHQYRGSRGIEMAMLMRRLKNRLREGGRSDGFSCIATSATLVSEEDQKDEVASFTSELFDEPFFDEDIILGETEPIRDTTTVLLSSDVYTELSDILNSERVDANSLIAEIAEKNNILIQAHLDLPKTIGALLQQDSRSLHLRQQISGNPLKVRNLSDIIFDDLPDNQRITALSKLVQLLVRAKKPIENVPLLSARYHLFLRSLEGAFVAYWPEKKVFLERTLGDNEYQAFEVALCKECGQHYFVGQKNFRQGLGEAIRDPSHFNFGATFFRPIDEIWALDDHETRNGQNRSEYQLCVQCGAISRDQTNCGHNNSIRVIKEEPPKDEDRKDQIAKCGACGYHASGHDPVREVVHGTDGPHAVIATTLYQHLPLDRKKILAFADSRQQAAFFAWYLEDSYKNILNRNLLLNVIRDLEGFTNDGLSLQELSVGLRTSYSDNNVFPSSIGEIALRQNTWKGIYREFVTDEPRISLEGVGLIQWSLKWPYWFEVPDILNNSPWSLSENEAQNLVFILLNFMRSDKAVEIRTERGVSMSWKDLNLIESQLRIKIGKPGGQYGVQSWDGKTGKRARYLEKILVKKGVSENEATDHAVETLRTIWESIRNNDEKAPSSTDRLLLHVDDGRRLNPDWWRIRSLPKDNIIYKCRTCGRLQTLSVEDVCQRYRCSGTLDATRIGDLTINHYRYLYETDLPGSLIVEEHTAQLDKDKARKIQRDFRDDRINVLSCSTTFELGVDLGNLDTVFLRNVPPESFNYTQRVGRSGRRSGYPGFAVTFCRRSPHDLYHFAKPERILNGKIQPPTLRVRNEKIILRHITATALSAFFREYPDRFRTVESLFGDLSNPTGVSSFHSFLQSNRAKLTQTLETIVPPLLFDDIGLTTGNWINKISCYEDDASFDDEESKFSLAEAEISSDFINVLIVEEESRNNRQYRAADWARRRANTIAGENVLNFLSRKVVIPKYSFPVDVVELDTQKASHSHENYAIMLQRNLSIAISEFAPTSKLVANKKLWTSYGIKKVAEKEWPIRLYKRCARHNVFLQWGLGDQEPLTPCGCDLTVFKYIIPRFGFITKQEPPKDPTHRPARVFTSRPYFTSYIDGGGDSNFINAPDGSSLLVLKKASSGQLTVICEGRRSEGFYICERCGAGFRRRPKSHQTPYGSECRGTLSQVSLGHEFVTDVLQLQFIPRPEAIDPIWFAYSLAYALVEGAAEVLGVPSTDLNATVVHQVEYYIPPIVLYDNVPGGAGLVARLEEQDILKSCLEAALNRVSGNCNCDEETSCYGCLRNYRNQFAHQHLQRGPVKRYLEILLSILS